MFKPRRNIHEPRLELTPLIDVVFLLLTFFVFAIMLMVRADLLDVSIPTLGAGRPAEPGAAITVAVDASGALHLNGEPAASPDDLITRIRALREASPDARIFIAADQDGRSGDLLTLVDHLAGAGLGDFSLVGKPAPQTAPTPPPTP